MRVLAFIRAMKWKGLIITAVLTAVLGLMLTLYSCKPATTKASKTEVQSASVGTVQGEMAKKDNVSCTANTCAIE